MTTPPPPQTSHYVTESSDEQKVLKLSMTGLSSTVRVQFISRILTFSLNLVLVRFLSPAVYGIAAVQLHLLYTSALFLAREGTRRVSMRSNIQILHGRFDSSTSSLINLAWATVPVGIILSILISLLFCWRPQTDVRDLFSMFTCIKETDVFFFFFLCI